MSGKTFVSPGSPKSPGINLNATHTDLHPDSKQQEIQRIPINFLPTAEGIIGIVSRESSGEGFDGPSD